MFTASVSCYFSPIVSIKFSPDLYIFLHYSAIHTIITISKFFFPKNLKHTSILKKLSFSSFLTLHQVAIFLLFSFLNLLSVSKPVLWTPGTAQIGEGIENSWGDLEDSEKEDEDEGGSDEAIILDSIKTDTGVEISNIGSQGMWNCISPDYRDLICILAIAFLEGLNNLWFKQKGNIVTCIREILSKQNSLLQCKKCCISTQ